MATKRPGGKGVTQRVSIQQGRGASSPIARQQMKGYVRSSGGNAGFPFPRPGTITTRVNPPSAGV